MKKSYYWNWLASIAKLSHTRRNGTMESTTSKSPIKEKAVIAAFLAVITALTSLLNDAEAAAQSLAPPPTYEFYGTDIERIYRVVNLGIVPIMPIYRFGAWDLMDLKINRVCKPGSRDREESVVTWRHHWPEGTQETYGRYYDTGSTRWYVSDGQDPPFDNRFHYYLEKDFTTGKVNEINLGNDDIPAAEFKSKDWLVGSRTWYTGLGWRGNINSGTQKHAGRWRTYMKLTAQHTSGGAKRFTVIIDYYVEGSPTATRITQHVTLSPGETTTMTLSAPSGDWASIGGVTIRENAPPAPIPTDGNGGGSGGSGEGDTPKAKVKITIGPITIELPFGSNSNTQSTNQAQRQSGNGN